MSALALAPEARPGVIAVTNPFDSTEVGRVEDVPAEAARTLLAAANEGARIGRGLSRHERARVLETCASLVERDREAFAALVVAEAGKTIRQARKEVLRCVNTLKLSADEARRNGGEVVPFDAWSGSEDRQGWFTREPLGIVVAITPYNDPLNLVAHKLGPAIAGGNAVILKPSELAPLSAIKLVATLVAAGMPPSLVTVATGGAALGEALVSASDVRMVSFTGGFATGERIARSAGLKRLAMDLGGNAPVFTSDLQAALQAADGLEAGGVMINDSSDYRFDAMPFGGFKYGSLGREGVRFAYEEMTRPKVVCIRKARR